MVITVNGNSMTTSENLTALDIKEEFFPLADVVIINGFQTNENLVLHDKDEISLIEKGKMPCQKELESLMSARHTPEVFSKVKCAKVAVAGLGGLGSNIAVMLARTGVGELFLVDFDVVEPSNLNRQCYYISHLGLNKTDAMAQQIKQINPFIKVVTKTVRVTEKNAAELFDGYDIVCEAFDLPENKAALVSKLLESCSCKIVSASGMAGYFSSNKIKTVKRLNRLYICGDEENEAKAGNGLMAPRVGICAAHQANMVLRLILGIEHV